MGLDLNGKNAILAENFVIKILMCFNFDQHFWGQIKSSEALYGKEKATPRKKSTFQISWFFEALFKRKSTILSKNS